MSTNKNINSNNINQAINLLEDIIWVIKSKKDVDVNNVPDILRNYYNNYNFKAINNNIRNEDNVNYLVGVLPGLFQDEKLFNKNSDIINFAESVLNIKVSKAAKRSRLEYIGSIVCEVSKIKDDNYRNLVNALKNIIGNEYKMKQIKIEKKKVNFSWNETIRKLSEL